MAHLVDSSGALGPHEALNSSNFIPCTADVPNLGISNAIHWLRFTIHNPGNDPSVTVSLPHPEIDDLAIYVANGQDLDQIAAAGQSCSVPWRIDEGSEFSYIIPVRSGGEATVLLRLRSKKQLQVPVLVSSSAQAGSMRATRNLAFGVYVGIMVVMAMYNLFVFLSIRDKGYLMYVFYIVLVTLTQLTFFGFGQFHMWPGSAWLSSNASIILTLATAIAATEFMKAFLATHTLIPRAHAFFKWFYGAFAISLAVYLFVDPIIGYQLAQAMSGLYALFFLVASIAAVRTGSRQARYFLLAWSLFLAGTVVFVLKDAGVLPYNMVTSYMMPFGSAIEGVLLSFALADRINILRREKEQSQAEALSAAQENARIIRDQNVILEQKVTERTHQLQESLDKLKETQSQLVEAEKMSSLGQLTAGIAHEINNPINYIRSNIKPLRRDLEDLLVLLQAYRTGTPAAEVKALEHKLGIEETVAEVNAILHSMEEGADRTAEIVRGLRTFSRLDEGDLKNVDVNEGIHSTLKLLNPQIKDRVQVELDLQANMPVECLPGRLNQVFMNMLTNAIQAVKEKHGDEGGHILVRTEQDHEQLLVTIVDNGTGMSPATRARVFEPFFTTKNVGEGTGLGLSIAHSIVEKHHGRIEVDSIEGEGTMFRIIIPLRQPGLIAKRA